MIHQTLMGYSFGVQKLPGVGADGTPQQMTTLVFQNEEDGLTLFLPLDDDAREELLRQLTGGIVVPMKRIT